MSRTQERSRTLRRKMDVLIETFDREPRALCRIPTISESLSFRNVHFFELFYICKEHLRRQAVCLYIIDQTIRIICKGIRRLLLVHIRGEKKASSHTCRSLNVWKEFNRFEILYRECISTRTRRTIYTLSNIFTTTYFFIYIISLKTKQKKTMRHCRQISQIN